VLGRTLNAAHHDMLDLSILSPSDLLVWWHVVQCCDGFEMETETAVLIQNRTETSKFCRLTNGFISDTPRTKIRLC